MLVQRVSPPGSRVESWTVLGDGDVPVEPIERYLAYLSGIERSPNTVKAYAHDLFTTAEFLPQHRQHHGQVLQIISAAEARGQTRLVEMNRHVADNLETIITALEDDGDTQVTSNAS